MVVQEQVVQVVRQELEQVERVVIVVHQVQVEHRAFKEHKDNKEIVVVQEHQGFKEHKVNKD